jgi:threonine aldolase
MVFVEVPRERLPQLRMAMETRRVRLSIDDAPQLRLVLHLDVDDAGVQRVVEGFRALAGNG